MSETQSSATDPAAEPNGSVPVTDVEGVDDLDAGVGPAEPAEVDEPEQAEPSYTVIDCTGDDFAAGADAARQAVERGECIVLPTDTVYGIGADAFSAEAVQRLLDAKRRGRDKPPAVLIADAAMIKALAGDVPQAALDLVARHWPGALTIICKAHPSVSLDLGETDGTIALRVPDHPLARDLLRRTGPLAVSSANLTGSPPALRIGDAIDMLGNSVSVYLDGGELRRSPGASADGAGPDTLPSTMVDFTRNDHGVVLRAGAIPAEVLQETVPGLVGLGRPRAVGRSTDIASAIEALADATPEPDAAEPDAAEPDVAEPEAAEVADQRGSWPVLPGEHEPSEEPAADHPAGATGSDGAGEPATPGEPPPRAHA